MDAAWLSTGLRTTQTRHPPTAAQLQLPAVRSLSEATCPLGRFRPATIWTPTGRPVLPWPHPVQLPEGRCSTEAEDADTATGMDPHRVRQPDDMEGRSWQEQTQRRTRRGTSNWGIRAVWPWATRTSRTG